MHIPLISGALRFLGSLGRPSKARPNSAKAPTKPRSDPSYFQDSQDLSPGGREPLGPTVNGEGANDLVQQSIQAFEPSEQEFLSQLSPRDRAIYMARKGVMLEGAWSQELRSPQGLPGQPWGVGSWDMGMGYAEMPPYDFSQYDPNDPMVKMMDSLEPGWNKDYEKSDAAQLQVLKRLAKTPIKG